MGIIGDRSLLIKESLLPEALEVPRQLDACLNYAGVPEAERHLDGVFLKLDRPVSLLGMAARFKLVTNTGDLETWRELMDAPQRLQHNPEYATAIRNVNAAVLMSAPKDQPHEQTFGVMLKELRLAGGHTQVSLNGLLDEEMACENLHGKIQISGKLISTWEKYDPADVTDEKKKIKHTPSDEQYAALKAIFRRDGVDMDETALDEMYVWTKDYYVEKSQAESPVNKLSDVSASAQVDGVAAERGSVEKGGRKN